MCKINIPTPPEVPMADPPPDFMDEQVALAQTIQQQRNKRLFSGLASTITNPQGAAGVLTPGRTTSNAR